MIEAARDKENVHGQSRMVATLNEAALVQRIRDQVSQHGAAGAGRGVYEGQQLEGSRRHDPNNRTNQHVQHAVEDFDKIRCVGGGANAGRWTGRKR